jgi:MauM/NapG family ferredoxin protein
MTMKARNNKKLAFRLEHWGRRLVQAGFLALFLYPLIVVVYQRASFTQLPTLTSWLFPWDPALLLGHLFQRNLVGLVIGAPLTLLALTFIFGSSFCGWVCPTGTLLDWIRPLAFWRRGRRKKALFEKNSTLRFALLVSVLAGSLVSIKLLGIFDPLVIFNRVAVSLFVNIVAFLTSGERAVLSFFSLLFVAILALELWRPRFWCRSLCPLGALLSLVSRFSLLNRRVSTACTGCAECRRACPMNAIPKDAHNTDYTQCTFCLECASDCPKNGITFGFGNLAQQAWQPDTQDTRRRLGTFTRLDTKQPLDRRQFLTYLASGAAGIAGVTLLDFGKQTTVIRPPGALPEEEFLRTCITCQECVRVCPTGGLRPAFLESGLKGIGTPMLVPRLGGCSLNPSCPNLCARVCPVGALKLTRKEDLKLGIARVDRGSCLAWDQGVKCLVCVEACLVGAARPFNGRVVVDPTKCTGCGRCESGCPVAGSAIRVMPAT